MTTQATLFNPDSTVIRCEARACRNDADPRTTRNCEIGARRDVSLCHNHWERWRHGDELQIKHDPANGTIPY